MSDNGRNRRTLEFDLADAPMLARALSVGACTAMLDGRKDAQRRLETYRDLVAQMVPAEADLFDEEVWAEMGMALAKGGSWSVGVTQAPWDKRWLGSGPICVKVGRREWLSQGIDRYRIDAPEIEAVAGVIADLAPMDSVRKKMLFPWERTADVDA